MDEITSTYNYLIDSDDESTITYNYLIDSSDDEGRKEKRPRFEPMQKPLRKAQILKGNEPRQKSEAPPAKKSEAPPAISSLKKPKKPHGVNARERRQ